jgi:hypothetical protein
MKNEPGRPLSPLVGGYKSVPFALPRNERQFLADAVRIDRCEGYCLFSERGRPLRKVPGNRRRDGDQGDDGHDGAPLFHDYQR